MKITTAILRFMPTSGVLMPQVKFVGVVVGGCITSFVIIRILIHMARWCATPIIIIPGSTRNSIYGPMGNGRGEDLSADQKEEIDELRSNAIRRHLHRVTVTLTRNDILPLQSDKIIVHPSLPATKCSLMGNKSTDEEENQITDIDEETITGYKSEASEEKCTEECRSQLSLPLLAYDLNVSSTSTSTCNSSTHQKYRILLQRAPKEKKEDEKENTIIVDDECAICHEEYELADRICHSSNLKCNHVFHQRCMVDWLVSLGWIKSKNDSIGGRRLFSKVYESPINDAELLNYDLECPCCRQNFVDRSLLLDDVQGDDNV